MRVVRSLKTRKTSAFFEVNMNRIKKWANYFSKGELVLWGSSVTLILLSFVLFDRSNYLAMISSLVGATSLIFNAKGNPFGQFLMVVFGVCYGVISFGFGYYGEMITYLGMTAPMQPEGIRPW